MVATLTLQAVAQDDATRPRFTPGFWGEGGIERIHAETGGWPHLVPRIEIRGWML